MRVYICYDRYEHNEWFNVYYVGTDREESVRHCKETDLPDFLCYGPDDCHSFQLVEVDIPEQMIKQLFDWKETIGCCENVEEDREYYNFMCDLYDDFYNNDDMEFIGNIISTDGCSDYYEIVRYYSVFYKNKDTEDVYEHDFVFSDEFDEYMEELQDDDDLWEKVMKEYIQDTY